MDVNKQYVTRLMYANCDLGSMDNKLNLPEDHGVAFGDKDHPLMNANDHIPKQHIIHFGRCKSSKNPGNTASLETMLIDSLIIPGLGQMLSVTPFSPSKMFKKLIGCEGCKCSPLVITPWVKTNKKHIIDGAPALLMESEAVCFYGGTIKIVEKKEGAESGENAAKAAEAVEKKNPLASLPQAMQDKIKDFCSEPNVSASPDAVMAVENNAADFNSAIQGGRVTDGATAGSSVPNAFTAPAGNTNSFVAAPRSSTPNYFAGNTFVASPAFTGAVPDLTAIGILNGCAGLPGVNFFESMSIQNLVANQGQMILPGALDAIGNIADISQLYNFNIGNTVLSVADFGSAALYNVMNMMGRSPDLPDIIFQMEQYALRHLLPVGGPMISTAASMVDYFVQKGINTHTLIKTGKELVGMFAGKLPVITSINLPVQLPINPKTLLPGIPGTPPFVPEKVKAFVPVEDISDISQFLTCGGIIGSIDKLGGNPTYQPIQIGIPEQSEKIGKMKFPDHAPQVLIKF